MFGTTYVKLPETTPNATFRLGSKVAIRRRKQGEIAAFDFDVESASRTTKLSRHKRQRNPIEVARQYQTYLNQPDVEGYREVAEHFGVTKAKVSHYLSMIQRLPPRFVSWLEQCCDPAVLRCFTVRDLRSAARESENGQLLYLRNVASQLDATDPRLKELFSILGEARTVDRVVG